MSSNVCSLILLFILTVSSIKAQVNYELIIRSNLGIGADYTSLEYSNINSEGELLYSPGGGIGLELGLACLPFKSIEVYSTLGYQQNLALQYQSSSNGETDKTSFSFSRGSILIGANYIYKFSEKMGLKIGGGGSYNIPGKMSVTELNVDYGKFTFDSEFGFHLETGFFYELKNWKFFPSIRYRNLNFYLKDYNQQINISSRRAENYEQLLSNIKNLNANGVDLSLTIRRKLNNN